jgi:hypothetical protein
MDSRRVDHSRGQNSRGHEKLFLPRKASGMSLKVSPTTVEALMMRHSLTAAVLIALFATFHVEGFGRDT